MRTEQAIQEYSASRAQSSGAHVRIVEFSCVPANSSPELSGSTDSRLPVAHPTTCLHAQPNGACMLSV